jgi:hypothetical protein
MTHEDVLQALETMQAGDNEAVHYAADDLLLNFLRSEGYNDIAEAYERARDRVGFWYA